MANIFKMRFIPNPDGTNSATAITNVNTAFVHTYIGDDLTGDGTREYPFKSVFKANQKSGINYIVFRGVINEYVSYYGKLYIGDDINQCIITENFDPAINSLCNLTIDKMPSTRVWNDELVRVISVSVFSPFYTDFCKFSFLKGGVINGQAGLRACENPTIIGFQNLGMTVEMKNGVLINEFDIYNIANLTIKYCVLPSDTVFKYNGALLNSPEWVNNSIANLELIRACYVDAGMSQHDANLLFHRDSFDNETCKIIWEQKDGGTHPNIFNRYNEDGSVADYSLNPNLYNEALYAGDTGSFVGCFKPADAVVSADWNASLDVNADGTDTVNAGTLLRINVDDTIDFNAASGQIWNRLKCNQTIVIPNGIKFDGTPISSNDGSAFGYYFGKHQDLMNPAALTPADTLEPNCIYKVCNPLRSIYQAAIFDGNQYLPDYFFKTGEDVLAFTLLNGDSGTVVKKVLAVPMESIEVIPYDDIATPSPTFPRFSSPMFGSCYMLYHKIGDHIDEPVLFSEVENDKIAYYDAWAVTNADQEFATLVLDTVNYYSKVPILKYLRTELNGHFNADYDQ